MARGISEGRKTLYYLGGGIQVLGALMFASVFLTAITSFGDFSNFDANARSDMTRAFGGMALLVVGAILRGIGAKGLAGSGVVLDPSKVRDDLEPYSRMAGGMLKDALDESDIGAGHQPVRVVMVKCPSCSTLNQESAKFCQECGGKL